MTYRLIDTGKCIGVILAGGEGTRLYPLTAMRAKPAVPIGGHHRLIDLPLSNLLNSGITRNFVIVQHHPSTLMQHLDGYQNGIAQMRGQFIRVLAPPHEVPRFFESDSDSLVQLRRQIEDVDAEIIVVMMADQIVKIDLRQVIYELLEKNADALMVYRAVLVEHARKKLGVLQVDENGFVADIVEKPENPPRLLGQSDLCLANLALYVFRKAVFSEMLAHIGENHEPNAPLSLTGIPWVIKNVRVAGYNLMQNEIPGMFGREKGHFRDAGTLDSWYEIQMEMCHRDPVLNLYSREWPYFTSPVWPTSPAKIDRADRIDQAMIGPNVILQDDASALESILSTGCMVGRRSKVCSSVVLNDARISEDCFLNRVVIEEGVKVPAGALLDGSHPPHSTVKFADAYAGISRGEDLPRNAAILSDNGILFIPIDYQF